MKLLITENPMIHIGSYQVPVKAGGLEKSAILTPAIAHALPTNWTFPWTSLWETCGSEGLGIVQLVLEEQVWGLVRYGVFPKDTQKFVLIEHLEAHPASRGSTANRLVEPVGKWLIWYCVNVGLQHCSGDEKLVFLFSKAPAFEYYSSKIQMEYKRTVDLSPGEKVHAFEFSRISATAYSQRQEKTWGTPQPFGYQAESSDCETESLDPRASEGRHRSSQDLC